MLYVTGVDYCLRKILDLAVHKLQHHLHYFETEYEQSCNWGDLCWPEVDL